MDTVSKKRRSEIMSHIRSKDTTPEIRVRSLVHRLGYRYRLHCRKLPGTPDLVFPSRKKVIFVHGCFFHMHKGCGAARIPKSRVRFWSDKLYGNVKRDAKAKRALTRLGWHYMVIWECEITQKDKLAEQIRAFMEDVV